MNRKPVITILLISIAFLLFFSHQYLAFDNSQTSFTEIPEPSICCALPLIPPNQSEHFNLYGSTISITAFANLTFNSSITKGTDIKVIPTLSISLMRVSKNGIPRYIKNLTYNKLEMFNSTKIHVSPGNYIINSSFSIYVFGTNRSELLNISQSISNSLKGSVLVNIDTNFLPYVISIPTYFFGVLTVIFLVLTITFRRRGYDIRHLKK